MEEGWRWSHHHVTPWYDCNEIEIWETRYVVAFQIAKSKLPGCICAKAQIEVTNAAVLQNRRSKRKTDGLGKKEDVMQNEATRPPPLYALKLWSWSHHSRRTSLKMKGNNWFKVKTSSSSASFLLNKWGRICKCLWRSFKCLHKTRAHFQLSPLPHSISSSSSSSNTFNFGFNFRFNFDESAEELLYGNRVDDDGYGFG